MDSIEQFYARWVRHERMPPRLARVVKLGAVLVRELARDQVHVRAATLAYWSLVAMVPMLVLSVGLLRLLGLEHSVPVRELLWRTILAGSVESVGVTLDQWIDAVDFGKLSLAGILGVMLAGSRIYFSAEEAFNRLWTVRVRRAFAMRLMVFYATVTLGPVLIAAGFLLSARVQATVDVSALQWISPVFMTALAFVLAIKFLPDTDVRWFPALTGGLVAASLFELAKLGFSTYVDIVGAAQAAAAIYGSLALFPVFLLWLYLMWIIVLLGVELAFVTQRHADLLVAEDRHLAGPHRRRPDALFALQCLLVVARRFEQGLGPSPEPVVTRIIASDPTHVWEALETLEEAQFLTEGPIGYSLARPPNRLRVREVLDRVRALTRPEISPDAPGAALIEGVFHDAPSLDVTVAELV